jgi:hypothetical protein
LPSSGSKLISSAQTEVAINISISVAVLSVVKFYTALKKDLKHHKPLAKLLAFKLIVGLTFLEGVRLPSLLHSDKRMLTPT